MDKAIHDFYRMADNLNKTKISKQQQYWQDRADSLAMLTKKTMVVIQTGADHFQVWNKNLIGKNMDWVYCTEEVQHD